MEIFHYNVKISKKSVESQNLTSEDYMKKAMPF